MMRGVLLLLGPLCSQALTKQLTPLMKVSGEGHRLWDQTDLGSNLTIACKLWGRRKGTWLLSASMFSSVSWE